MKLITSLREGRPSAPLAKRRDRTRRNESHRLAKHTPHPRRDRDPMGNALAREFIRLSHEIWNAGLSQVSTNTWLELLAKARTRMKCVSMNPDERAVLDCIGLMHELNVRGPHIDSPASLKATNLSLDILFFQCAHADQEEFANLFRFYVPDKSSEIKAKSKIHFLTLAIEDGVEGVVLFFDERAADFAKLYVATFCPKVEFDANGGKCGINLKSEHIPPLSDLLGFTRRGSSILQGVLHSIEDSFAVRTLRECPSYVPDSMKCRYTLSVVKAMCDHYSHIDYESLGLTSVPSITTDKLVRIVFITAIFDYFRAPERGTIPVEDRPRFSDIMYENLKVDGGALDKRVGFVTSNRIVELAIYKNARTRASIEGPSMICFVINLFVDLTIDTFRSQLAKHAELALVILRREQKEEQQRIERVISRCVGAAIAAVKLKHMIERREQLDELRRRAELEETAARQAKLKVERLARAAAPPKRAPKAPAQEPRTARAARLPPPAVEAKLKSARQEAAKEHEKYLKVRESERVAELEELAEKVRIGSRIARGD